MSTSSNRVSVIMRSRNSAATIAHALTGLFSQDYRDFDLLVVDSGSTDNTCLVIEQFPCRLVHIGQGDYFPGTVLNDAIEQTEDELIVFLNSDAVPLTPSALGHLVDAFDDLDTQAAFGRQVHRPEAHTWVRRDYEASFPGTPPPPSWLKMSLAFAAMRRSAWQRHAFYADAWASEDQEWAAWAERNGCKVQYVPQALVMHSHNYTLRQLHGRRFVEGEAGAFIYGEKVSFMRGLTKASLDSGRDVVNHLRCADFGGLPWIPLRRLVFHYSYYKGHKWGEQRIATGNKNAAIGQATVLDRHDDGPTP